MNRYHKKVYFPANRIELVQFSNTLNSLQWSFSAHCLDNIKHRDIKIEQLLLFIKDKILFADDIFEYYQDIIIEKACFRLQYIDGYDIILVISNQKKIITIYLNAKDDEHYTLRHAQYTKE